MKFVSCDAFHALLHDRANRTAYQAALEEQSDPFLTYQKSLGINDMSAEPKIRIRWFRNEDDIFVEARDLLDQFPYKELAAYPGV